MRKQMDDTVDVLVMDMGSRSVKAGFGHDADGSAPLVELTAGVGAVVKNARWIGPWYKARSIENAQVITS